MSNPLTSSGGGGRSSPSVAVPPKQVDATSVPPSFRSHSPQSSLNLSNLSNRNLGTPGKTGPESAATQEVLNVVGAALSENGFTERDIWDANPQLLQIFNRFRPQLDSLLKPNSPVFINLDFTYVEEFSKAGYSNKVYKVDATKLVWQTISLIFSKISSSLSSSTSSSNAASSNIQSVNSAITSGGLNFRRYSLRTTAGNLLDDNAPLSTYALGSLFAKWDLVMVKKSAEQFAAARPSTSPLAAESYMVTFVPGDGPVFQGVSRVTRKVKADTPTGQLIEQFCKRYSIPKSDNLILTSNSDMFLSRKESLGYYGLGKKFDSMTVKLVERTPSIQSGAESSSGAFSGNNANQSSGIHGAPPKVSGFSAGNRPSSQSNAARNPRHSIMVSPDVAWTQLDDSLSLKEARVVILDLDHQVSELKTSLSLSQQQRAEEREQMRNLLLKERQSFNELESQHDQLRLQAKKLVDVYVAAKEKQDGLLAEKGALESDILQMKTDIANMRELMRRAREELIQSRAEATSKSEQLRVTQGELLAQQFDFEQVKLGLEHKITTLDHELQLETNKTLELYSQQILNQDEIERQKSQIVGLKLDKNQLEEKLTESFNTEARLSAEVSSLKKELATSQYTEKQTKKALSDANDEISSMNSELAQARSLSAEFATHLDASIMEKRALEVSFDNAKSTYSSDIADKDRQIRSLSQQVETVSREKDDMKSNYESQIKGLTSSLQTNLSSKTASEQETSKLKEQLLNATSQQDSLKSANKSLTERVDSLQSEIQNLQEQLGASKEEITNVRSELSKSAQQAASAPVSTSSSTVAHDAQSDHMKKQITQLKEQLASEQNAAFDVTQAKQELESKVSQLTLQTSTLNQKIADLNKMYTELQNSKQEAALLAEKEAFKDLNAKISKLNSEKAELEKSIKEAATERSDLEKQIKELTTLNSDQAATIKEQKATITRLETPPPAPFMSDALRASQSSNAVKKDGKKTEGSLESEILGIKDTLQKIDTSALNKKKDFTSENVLSNLLMTGLEQRFRKARADDEYEDLASEDLFIPNESEEDWK